MPSPLIYRWEFEVPVPRKKLWNFVADTERVNRLAGLLKLKYTYKPLATGGSEVHAEGTSSGLTFRWIERPAEWVEPEFFQFTRDFIGGPFERLISRCELHENGLRATKIVQTLTVTPRGWVGRQVARYAVGFQTRRGFARAYAAAPEWVEGNPQVRGVAGKSRPAATGTERITRKFGALSDRLLGTPLGATPLAGKLANLVANGEDAEVAHLRPLVLAREWGAPPNDVLRLCLYAAKSGLLDLEWRLLCPGCLGANMTYSALKDVATNGHCPSCNISYGADFDRAVEVTFSPKPVRPNLEDARYCHFGPKNTPHRVTGWQLAAGETRRVEATLDPGIYQLTSAQASGGVFFSVAADKGTDAPPVISLQRDGVHGVPPGVAPTPTVYTVTNNTGVDAQLYVVRTQWADDAVTAADVTAMQEFRNLFGSEVLAPGASYSIRSMVFLFSDLVASTAMYEQLGDSKAFNLVRQHFDVLRDVYIKHKGTLVKTIGDAVMAVFRDPADAVRAAVEMHEKIGTVRDPDTGRDLALCIGLHAGPCIAMEANGVIDYFGTTVNTAARVQSQAKGYEITMSDAILGAPGVPEVLGARADRSHDTQRMLKGLSGAYRLHCVKIEPVTVTGYQSAKG
jgi:class 3 adenylate cyclase